ncbi:hypothetical protein ACYPKM_04370 [Pseudomonas aeruginosa]
MNTTEHKKLLQTVRSHLQGMAANDSSYNDCVRALNYIVERVHTGTRKDGVTPESYHQLSILGFLLTQHKNLINPRAVYMAAILHDVIEDYPELISEVALMFPDDIVYAIRLSKVRNGADVPYDLYFSEMAECPVCSVVKLADRIHNASTMAGVFSFEKTRKYLDEIIKYFLPMAKTARRNFPQQAAFYELSKSILSMKVANHSFYLDLIEEKGQKHQKSDLAVGM